MAQISSLVVRIRTLTPLWTGGVDGTMDRIHETGIIGSLRWWYEAIVRGLGGEACDPTRHECPTQDGHYCDVCKVFGATGWRRRFKFEIYRLDGKFDSVKGLFPSGRVHPSKNEPEYKAGGWFLHGGYQGELELKFLGDKQALLCEILPTLMFIEEWGALGPKTSIGYGVFKILEIKMDGESFSKNGDSWQSALSETIRKNCENSRVSQWWLGSLANINERSDGILPSLGNMFFFKIRYEVNEIGWWENFKEIGWLKRGSIPHNEATLIVKKTCKEYEIDNPFPVNKLEEWVNSEPINMFPIAPILRTKLRYRTINSISVCELFPKELDWCNFIFGTVKGRSPICGYCGFPVRKYDQPHKWLCPDREIPLDESEIIFDGGRLQSKIRISWAYKIGNNKWEFRVWGWIPEDKNSEKHQERRNTLLGSLQNLFGSKQLLHLKITDFIKR